MHLKKSILTTEISQYIEAVEEKLAEYRLIKYTKFFGQLPDEQTLSDSTNPELKELVTFCKEIERAVDSLPAMEKELIELRYMDLESDYITNQDIYESRLKQPISRPHYSKIRNRAIMKLAPLLVPMCCSLRIEYKQSVEG